VVTTAIYAGSFDPITRGHEDLIRRSCEFVDHLVVAVAVNSAKRALFTTDERVELIRLATAEHKCVEVTQFEGLLVDYAKRVGATLIIRGLRAVSDFEYEFQMALMNRHMSENLETVFERFYTARPKGAAFGGHSGLGLSIARQIVDAHGGRIWAENVMDTEGKVAGARFNVSLPEARL
jgi:pantetheine-phosphate adenylyltransferase